jgi:hypothetical protein
MTTLRAILLSWGLAAAFMSPCFATDLPTVGGGGGGSFRTACGPHGFLAGIRGRTGDWIDAIEAVCVRYDGASESAGPASPSGDVYGGNGGGSRTALCPAGMVVHGWEIASLDNGGQVLVQYIRPSCRPLPVRPGNPPTAIGAFFGGNGATDGSRTRAFSCPDGQLAVGLHGASGAYLDRVGLVCREAPFILGRPTPAPTPPQAKSTVRPTPSALGRTPAHPRVTPTDTLPANGAPLRAGRTYNSPMIVAANGETVMLDFCREWGSNCGKPAADAFCQSKGHADAARFEMSEDIGHTAIITSGTICNAPSCDGFVKIECNP